MTAAQMPHETGDQVVSAALDRWLLVIDDDTPITWRTLRGLPAAAALDCLLLIDTPTGRATAIAALAARGFECVTPLDTSVMVTDVCREARAAFIRFMAEWPTRPLRGGPSLRERLTVEPGLSLWWLTDCSMKDNENSRVFDRLCQVMLLQRLWARRPYAGAVVCSSDAAFRIACKSALAPAGGPAAMAPSIHPWHLAALAAHQLGRRLVHLAVLWLRFAARLRRAGCDRSAPGAVAFVVPPAWADADGRLMDRVYGEVPTEVVKHPGAEAVYLCTLSDGVRHVWGLDTSRLARPVVSLESYVTLSAMLQATFDLRALWRCLVVDRALGQQAVVNGANLSALLRRDLWQDLVAGRTLLYRLTARAVERYARMNRPSVMVCAHDLYPFARAVYYGGRRGGVRTAALQHAAISRMKLWHSFDPSELTLGTGMPLPDQYLFQGTLGERIARESGYPASRCVVVGGPRYDDWAQRLSAIDAGRVRTSLGVGSHERLVLVLSPLHARDEQLLMELVLEAAPELPDARFVFKVHPSSVMGARLRSRIQRVPDGSRCSVVSTDIRALLVASDVVVTTYSSTGDEAMALGKPVVAVGSPMRCGIASFEEIPAAPVVYTATGLAQAVRGATDAPDHFAPYRRHWSELVEASFLRLDGRAAARVTTALRASADAPATDESPSFLSA